VLEWLVSRARCAQSDYRPNPRRALARKSINQMPRLVTGTDQQCCILWSRITALALRNSDARSGPSKPWAGDSSKAHAEKQVQFEFQPRR
jgi:hypothetical protein